MAALRLADESQAKGSKLIQHANKIKVRAKRRCAELLVTAEKNTGERGIGTSAVDSTPTLKQMGLPRDESSRYQQLATMPSNRFETAVATVRLVRRAAFQAPEAGHPPAVLQPATRRSAP